jgi:predicted CXXCH cytochrome family protein
MMNDEYRMSNSEVKAINRKPNTTYRILLTANLLLMLFICLFPRQANTAPTCITEGCHSDLQKKFPVHPEEFACTDCHIGDYDKHDQLEVRLELSPQMCLECHEEVPEHKYPHAPVAENKCSACHNPHALPETALLRKDHPTQFYVDYTKDQYGLCFNCHKPELMMYPETAFATSFRDGIRNLHYLHVNKEKRGRNCKTCHDVHGSENPKLMAGTIRFGNWKMDMNFQISEKGGSCAPGCHRPQKYSREDNK